MGINIHLHIHNYPDRETKESLNLINNKLDKIMAKQEQFDAMVARLNTATNDIAADLKLLKDQIAAGTVSDESLAKLDADIVKLEALGASTDNPIPDPPPPVG